MLHHVHNIDTALLLFWVIHPFDIPRTLCNHLAFRKQFQQLLVSVQVSVNIKFLHAVERCIQELYMASPIYWIVLQIQTNSLLKSQLVALVDARLIEVLA